MRGNGRKRTDEEEKRFGKVSVKELKVKINGKVLAKVLIRD